MECRQRLWMSITGELDNRQGATQADVNAVSGAARAAYLLRLNSNVLAPGCTVNARPLVAVDA
jgi:hypothetical protein